LLRHGHEKTYTEAQKHRNTESLWFSKKAFHLSVLLCFRVTIFMDTPKPTSPLVNEHHCGNLRHKGMYVMTVPDPDEFTFYDKYDATHYWCTCTQRALGPDGRPVHPSTCTHAGGRACCEP